MTKGISSGFGIYLGFACLPTLGLLIAPAMGRGPVGREIVIWNFSQDSAIFNLANKIAAD